MKKFFTIGWLLLVIVGSFVFVGLKLWSLGLDDNYFNRHLRPVFAQSPFFRNALGLHFDGDAASDYLGGGYKEIVLEVDAMSGISPDRKALDMLVKQIQAVAKKPANYVISESNLPYREEVSDREILELSRSHHTFRSSGDTAVVYVLYVSRKAMEPDSLGATLQDWGIVLYKAALAEFTKSAPRTASHYEGSTALHEFGHQLGLSHNEESGCLMNTQVEKAVTALELPIDVITDFCETEKQQLATLYNQFNK